MIEPILMGLIVLYFFTLEILKKPKRETPKEKLLKGIAHYLDEDGIKVKIQKDE
ncbi:MAG: hypothetical protein AAF609_17670 [Cyanobacteria bacterium P01_C01_bin.120]